MQDAKYYGNIIIIVRLQDKLDLFFLVELIALAQIKRIDLLFSQN